MKSTDVSPRFELFLDGSFVDLTDRLTAMQTHRGKGHPQDDQSVGVAELQLRNHDRLINSDTFEPGLAARITYIDIGTPARLEYEGAGVFANWAGSSVVDVPDPPGAVAGDLVLASIGFNHSGNITPPAGWQTVWEFAGPDGSAGQYWRIHDGGPPADIRWLIDNGVSDAGGVSTLWRPPPGFFPFVLSTSANATAWPNSTEPLAWGGFIPPAYPGASVVAFYATPGSPISASPPPGWTYLVDINPPGGGAQVRCGLTLAPAGYNGRTARSWNFLNASSTVVGASILYGLDIDATPEPAAVFSGVTLAATFHRDYMARDHSVSITLQDDTRIVTNVEEAAWPDVGGGDTIAERVNRLLDVAAWPGGRTVGGGFGDLEGMDDGTSVAAELFEAVQRSEVGQWAVMANGDFLQLSRDQLFDPARMVDAIIIGRADLPISFGDAAWSTDRLINRAIGNRQQGGGQPNLVSQDDDSIAKYGVYADSFLEYSHTTNGETLAALQAEIAFYALPTIDNDVVMLWPVRNDWPETFAGLELLDPLIVWENGQFRQTVIYGIGHMWEPQTGWATTLQLWQYIGQLDDLLHLDDPALGLLDQNKLGAGSRFVVPT